MFMWVSACAMEARDTVSPGTVSRLAECQGLNWDHVFNILVKAHREEMASIIRRRARLGVGILL